MEANKLASSELVLNKDGGLYHLHLDINYLYDNVILVGDPKRVELISSYLDVVEYRSNNREIATACGKYKGVGITLISTGMGVDNIDIVLTELDAYCNIDLSTKTVNKEKRSLNIVRLGTSGSLQKDIPCGDCICSRYVIGIDGMMYFYENKEGIIDKELNQRFITEMNWQSPLPTPYSLGCIAKEEENNKDTLLNRLAFDMRKVITITAPGFYGPQQREIRLPLSIKNLNDRLPVFEYDGCKISNYEMETSSLYALSRNLGHNILTICLIIANRQRGEFLNDYTQEMQGLIEKVLERLTKVNNNE